MWLTGSVVTFVGLDRFSGKRSTAEGPVSEMALTSRASTTNMTGGDGMQHSAIVGISDERGRAGGELEGWILGGEVVQKDMDRPIHRRRLGLDRIRRPSSPQTNEINSFSFKTYLTLNLFISSTIHHHVAEPRKLEVVLQVRRLVLYRQPSLPRQQRHPRPVRQLQLLHPYQ